MAHYAKLDANGVVTMVFVGKDENENGVDWEEYYQAKRTSYNTMGGVHIDPISGAPSNTQHKAFRKNYAGIGFVFDPVRDAFIPPKPFSSWVLNEQTCLWEPPVPMPAGGAWRWDEYSVQWVAA